MRDSLKFHIERQQFGMVVALYAYFPSNEHTGEAFGQPLVFKQVPKGEVATKEDTRATMELGPNEAQRLVDELWQAGFRPSEGTGSAGSLAATQKHLEDMRALVFNPISKIPAEKGGVK